MKDLALQQFLLAYLKGKRTGHVEWEDLDLAFDMAKDAMSGEYESIEELFQEEDMFEYLQAAGEVVLLSRAP